MAYERDCLALARDVASLGQLMQAEEKTACLHVADTSNMMASLLLVFFFADCFYSL